SLGLRPPSRPSPFIRQAPPGDRNRRPRRGRTTRFLLAGVKRRAMRVGIVARRGNDRAAALAAEVREHLRESGAQVWIDEATADTLAIDGYPVARMSDCTLVVSIGGDGTFLFTAREVGTTPIMGVNLG